MAGQLHVHLRLFSFAFKAMFIIAGVDIAREELLKIEFEPNPNEIVLGKPLTVKCERTAGAVSHDGASIFLHCPIAPWNSFCFQNCISACAGEDPGSCPYENQLRHVTCRTVVSQDGHVTNEYTVEKVTEEWLGLEPGGSRRENGFYCKSVGMQTPEVWLSIKTTHSPEPIEREKSPMRVPMSSSWTENHLVITTASKLDLNVPGKTRFGLSMTNMGFRTSYHFRESLMILAIAIIFLSLTVNVFCCIRCALIRQYTKNKEKARMQHLFCMAEEIRCARRGSRHPDESRNTNYTQVNSGRCLMKGDANAFNNSDVPIHPLSGNPAYYVPAEFLYNATSYPVALNDTRSSTAARSEFYDGTANESVRTAPVMIGSANSGTPNHSLHYDHRHRHSKRSSIIASTGSEESHLIPTQNQLAAAVAAYCAQQRQNLNELQQQLQMDELSLQSAQAGSCPGSIGKPETLLIESQQLSSSHKSTLRRNSTCKQPVSLVGEQIPPALICSTCAKPNDGGEVIQTPTRHGNIVEKYSPNVPQYKQTNGQPVFDASSDTPLLPTICIASNSQRPVVLPLWNSNAYQQTIPSCSLSSSDSGTGTGSIVQEVAGSCKPEALEDGGSDLHSEVT
ncbi:unnamed protein product [Dicrocoelium dendriticum]|nr:unnamed protein product [Dicrocoelium dendriticum]